MLAAIADRCVELGLDIVPGLLLLGDVVLLVSAVALLLVLLEVDASRPLRAFLAAGLLLLAAVVASATVLSWLGMLGWRGLLLSHGLLAALALCVRLYGAAPARAARLTWRLAAGLGAPWARLATRPGWRKERVPENLLLLSILLVLVFYGALAFFAFPLNYDSNVYRLTRVAYWLQEGAVRAVAVDEPRLNIVPGNADLVMLWLTSFFHRHFPLVGLVQFSAGLLACATVYELCRALGFSRFWRLAAVLAFLGTPNAAVQFPTSQTDLFTTGCLWAGLLFLLEALRSGRTLDWCLFGVGLGLAVGAKPTVLYWGPGLSLLLVGWSRAEGVGWRALAKGLALAAPLVVCLAAPPYLHTWHRYGSAMAPAATVADVHKDVSGGSRAYFASVNGLAYLWQIFEPDSNLPLLAPLWNYPFRAIGALLLRLPEHYEGFHSWFVRMSGWLGYGPHEDYASFGFPLLLVSALGGGVALADAVRRRRPGMIAGFAFLSAVAFFGPFCLLQSWTVHKFRYFVLLTPILALSSVYGLRALPRRVGGTAALLFLGCQLAMALRVGIDGRDHGWRTLLEPERSHAYVAMTLDRRLLERLGAQPRQIAIALPRDVRFAAYMRSAADHRIQLESLKELRRYRTLEGYLRYKGVECVLTDPRVARRRPGAVRFDFPDEPGVATRVLACLAPHGEMPQPVVFATRGLFADGWTGLETVLRVENSRDGEGFELFNSTPLVRRIEIASSTGREELTLQPMEKRTVRIAAASRGKVKLRVGPPFVPAEVDPSSPDTRKLGVQLRLFTSIDGSG